LELDEEELKKYLEHVISVVKKKDKRKYFVSIGTKITSMLVATTPIPISAKKSVKMKK